VQISRPYQTLASVIGSAGYHGYTLWLFTVSDYKSFILPVASAGLLNLLAGSAINARQIGANDAIHVLSRIPSVLFWVWLNLLVVCVGNQRHPSSIAEDSANKPWRPLPTGRLSAASATMLWKCLHIIVPLTCVYFGATSVTIVGLVLGVLYNDLGGAEHPFFRNLLNSLAIVGCGLGATIVAYANQPFALGGPAVKWYIMLVSIVFTTIHLQDLCDQEGDQERGRRTIPLLWGDAMGRWTVILPMLTWSVIVPKFWDLPWWGFLGPCGIAATVCVRLILFKDAVADKKSYDMWGLWAACLLASPALTMAKNTQLTSG
jgi:4-hydroxybenzoate polyprenyltransferase